ncbi:MAG: phosphoglucomutase/phosphomannomutase family protein [Thermoanaerobaculia bacterium]|nr:phosphoglucomutase/phosphomannomutase family protein [Thermoanaerobaculia bacterium]
MIKFGTSGWRGIIGEDFTFENVRLVTQGIVNYLEANDLDPEAGIVVGYDTRFLSEKFALEAARVLSYNDVQAFLCTRDVPTPTVSYEILRRGAAGGINFTASHNPPEYNGLKFSTADGAPALPEVTRAIEVQIRELEEANERVDLYEKEEKIQMIDPRERYLAALREIVDLDAIRSSGLTLGVDSLFGTGREYLDYLLLSTNVRVKIIHNYRDPYFGGYSPECSQKNLRELRKLVPEEELQLGLATDGDADRFGIVDSRGRFVSPNLILALLALYLKRHRDFPGGLARSIATTHLIDRIAESLEVPVYETPVGFKFIGDLILEDQIAIGGEESAGLSVWGHVPEKDGILACLLVAEMMAVTKKRIGELIREMFDEFGEHFTKRIDLRLTNPLRESVGARLANPPEEIGGLEVTNVKTVDGVKLEFDDRTWLLFRLSGTEPVARLYGEACSPKELKKLLDAGKKFLKGG